MSMFRLVRMLVKAVVGDESEELEPVDVDDVDVDADDCDAGIDVGVLVGEAGGVDDDVNAALSGGITAESVSDKELEEMSGKDKQEKHYRHIPFTGIKGCNYCRKSKCPVFTPVAPNSDLCVCGHDKGDHEW